MNLREFILSHGHTEDYADRMVQAARDAHRHPTRGWKGPAFGVLWKRYFIEWRLKNENL